MVRKVLPGCDQLKGPNYPVSNLACTATQSLVPPKVLPRYRLWPTHGVCIGQVAVPGPTCQTLPQSKGARSNTVVLAKDVGSEVIWPDIHVS